MAIRTFVCILSIASSLLVAQSAKAMRGLPPGAAQPILQRDLPDALARARKPKDFRLEPLNANERQRLATPGAAGLRRAGTHRAVDSRSFEMSGLWTKSTEGKAIWRAAIHSPGARGIRLHFRDFDAGNGKLWLHDEAGVESAGPYSAQGPWNDGEFWSDIVLAETAYLTFEPGETNPIP